MDDDIRDPMLDEQISRIAGILSHILAVERMGTEHLPIIREQPAAPASAGAPPPHSASLEVPATLAGLAEEAGSCTACRLAEGRRHVVFGEGVTGATVMFVGEGPGAEEDATGRPFVGPAGQLLDRIIQAMGLDRATQTYICNTVKCRPPDNRQPAPDETSACNGFLSRQIELVRPRCIVALGAVAAGVLTGRADGVARQRGRFQKWRDIPLVVTYHPAALLRDPSRKRPVWDDMRLVMERLRLLV